MVPLCGRLIGAPIRPPSSFTAWIGRPGSPPMGMTRRPIVNASYAIGSKSSSSGTSPLGAVMEPGGSLVRSADGSKPRRRGNRNVCRLNDHASRLGKLLDDRQQCVRSESRRLVRVRPDNLGRHRTRP